MFSPEEIELIKREKANGTPKDTISGIISQMRSGEKVEDPRKPQSFSESSNGKTLVKLATGVKNTWQFLDTLGQQGAQAVEYGVAAATGNPVNRAPKPSEAITDFYNSVKGQSLKQTGKGLAQAGREFMSQKDLAVGGEHASTEKVGANDLPPAQGAIKRTKDLNSGALLGYSVKKAASYAAYAMAQPFIEPYMKKALENPAVKKTIAFLAPKVEKIKEEMGESEWNSTMDLGKAMLNLWGTKTIDTLKKAGITTASQLDDAIRSASTTVGGQVDDAARYAKQNFPSAVEATSAGAKNVAGMAEARLHIHNLASREKLAIELMEEQTGNVIKREGARGAKTGGLTGFISEKIVPEKLAAAKAIAENVPDLSRGWSGFKNYTKAYELVDDAIEKISNSTELKYALTGIKVQAKELKTLYKKEVLKLFHEQKSSMLLAGEKIPKEFGKFLNIIDDVIDKAAVNGSLSLDDVYRDVVKTMDRYAKTNKLSIKNISAGDLASMDAKAFMKIHEAGHNIIVDLGEKAGMGIGHMETLLTLKNLIKGKQFIEAAGASVPNNLVGTVIKYMHFTPLAAAGAAYVGTPLALPLAIASGAYFGGRAGLEGVRKLLYATEQGLDFLRTGNKHGLPQATLNKLKSLHANEIAELRAANSGLSKHIVSLEQSAKKVVRPRTVMPATDPNVQVPLQKEFTEDMATSGLKNAVPEDVVNPASLVKADKAIKKKAGSKKTLDNAMKKAKAPQGQKTVQNGMYTDIVNEQTGGDILGTSTDRMAGLKPKIREAEISSPDMMKDMSLKAEGNQLGMRKVGTMGEEVAQKAIKPGVDVFDRFLKALETNDIKSIRSLVGDMPEAFKKKFSTEITELLGKGWQKNPNMAAPTASTKGGIWESIKNSLKDTRGTIQVGGGFDDIMNKVDDLFERRSAGEFKKASPNELTNPGSSMAKEVQTVREALKKAAQDSEFKEVSKFVREQVLERLGTGEYTPNQEDLIRAIYNIKK